MCGQPGDTCTMERAKGTQRQGDGNSAGRVFCARCSSFFGKGSPPASNAQHPPYKDLLKLTQALEGWGRSTKGKDILWIAFTSTSPKEKQNLLLFWWMFTPAGKAVAGWQNVPGNRFHGRSHSSGYLPARLLWLRIPTGRAVAGMFKGASTPTAFLCLRSSVNLLRQTSAGLVRRRRQERRKCLQFSYSRPSAHLQSNAL